MSLYSGVADCPGGEDEGHHCHDFQCPGFYRCRGSRVCIHLTHLCDDVTHCPQSDDEEFCGITCPMTSCTCRGLELTCSKPYNVTDYPFVKYMNGFHSGFGLQNFHDNSYIIHLNLSSNHISMVGDNIKIPNLRELDISYNKITVITRSSILSLANLKLLIL